MDPSPIAMNKLQVFIGNYYTLWGVQETNTQLLER